METTNMFWAINFLYIINKSNDAQRIFSIYVKMYVMA